MKILTITAAGLLLAAPGLTGVWAADTSIPVTPGKYRINKETTSSLRPEPVKKTEDKCVADPVFDSGDALPDEENCSVSNVVKSGSEVTFDIDCRGGPGMLPMTGKAVCGSTADTLRWNFTMSGIMKDIVVTIVSKGEGERIGECE